MRISQQTANAVALKLTDKFKVARDEAQKAFFEIVTATYESHVPKAVTDLYKSHPDFTRITSSIVVHGSGFHREGVRTTRNVICHANGYTVEYTPTQKEAKLFAAAFRAWESAKEKYDQILRETETALISLRTVNNIAKNLPEAAPFLPPATSTAIVPNLTKLRSQLKAA
jgi:hypothetical protein